MYINLDVAKSTRNFISNKKKYIKIINLIE